LDSKAANQSTSGSFEVGIDGQTCSIAVFVCTWSFTIPAASSSESLLIDSAIQSRSIEALLGHPASVELLEEYYSNMIDHRVNAIAWGGIVPNVLLSITKSAADGYNVTLNTTDHDAVVARLVSRGVRYLNMPKVAHFTDEPHKFPANTSFCAGSFCEPVLGDSGEATPQFVELFAAVNHALKAHYASKGWLNMSYVMFKDEPLFTDNSTLQTWLVIAQQLKKLDLQIIQTTFPLVPEVWPYVDWWVAHIVQWSDPTLSAAMSKLKAQTGVPLSLYHNGVEITDLQGTRLLTFPWMMVEQDVLTDVPGLDGTLAWYSDDAWHSNPYTDADQYCQTPGSARCAAGWGYLLLPSKIAGSLVATPVSSIRWELFRLGLEDAEMFRLAKRTLRSTVEHCTNHRDAYCIAADKLSAALPRIKEVAWGWYEVTDYTESTYTHNATLVNDVRATIAAALNAVIGQ